MKFLSYEKKIYSYKILTHKTENEVLDKIDEHAKLNKDLKFTDYNEKGIVSFQLLETFYMANSFIPVFYGKIERISSDNIIVSGYFGYYKAIKAFLILMYIFSSILITAGFWMTWEWILFEAGAMLFLTLFQLFGSYISRGSKDTILKFLDQTCKNIL